MAIINIHDGILLNIALRPPLTVPCLGYRRFSHPPLLVLSTSPADIAQKQPPVSLKRIYIYIIIIY